MSPGKRQGIFRAALNQAAQALAQGLDDAQYIFSVFWTGYQMIAGVVDQMTRSFYGHALFVSQSQARAYADKGRFPVRLLTPLERHAFIPTASRAHSAKHFVTNV
jgi:hypothetical protein